MLTLPYDVVLNHPGGVLVPRSPARQSDLIVQGPLPWVDVRAHGATGDGTTDDTAAVLAALAVAQGAAYPGILYFPAGAYVLSGAGDELLLVTKAIRILGAGMRATRLLVAASVGASTDVIHYVPPAGGAQSIGLEISDLMILPVSGTPGRHAINIDTTIADRYASEFIIQRVTLVELGSRAIEATNPLPTTGAFRATVRNCVIRGGIRLLNAGDSINIHDNTITGANVGIEIDQVAGAALLNVHRNNITADGGGVWVKGAVHPIIRDNWFERAAALVGGSGNSALIDLDGGASDRIALPEIRGNMIALTTAALDGVRVNYADQAQVEGNTFTLVHADSRGVRATVNATSVRERDNRVVSGLASALIEYAGAASAHPPTTVYEDVDDFTGGVLTAGQIGKLGWNAIAGTLTTPDDPGGHPGIVRHATTTTINTVAVVHLRTNTGAVLLPSSWFDIEWLIRVNQADAETTVRYGFAAGVGANPPVNGIYLERLAADTNWFAVTRAASSQTRATMGVAMDTNWVRLRIRRMSSTQIAFSVNGGTEVIATLTIPTVTLQPFCQITNTAAADKTHDLDRFSIVVAGLVR